jgi:membrane associated rhomboid family serine protease
MTKNPFYLVSIQALMFMILPMLAYVWMPGHQSPWYTFGIYPREIHGLWGLIFAPFIHGNTSHLFSNVLPLGVLSFLSLWVLRRHFYTLTLGILVLGGLLTWFIGRPSWHIGASGLIYGYVGFLIASGIVAENVRLLGLTLLTVFLYGSLVWGLLPLQPDISFESHISGGIAGLALAFLFRSKLPKKKTYAWEHEEDLEEQPNSLAEEESHPLPPSVRVQYEWVSQRKNEDIKPQE